MQTAKVIRGKLQAAAARRSKAAAQAQSGQDAARQSSKAARSLILYLLIMPFVLYTENKCTSPGVQSSLHTPFQHECEKNGYLRVVMI